LADSALKYERFTTSLVSKINLLFFLKVGSKGFPFFRVLGYRNENGGAVDEVFWELFGSGRYKQQDYFCFLIVETLTKPVIVSRAQTGDSKNILADLLRRVPNLTRDSTRSSTIEK
jgi:hypothetical protein